MHQFKNQQDQGYRGNCIVEGGSYGDCWYRVYRLDPDPNPPFSPDIILWFKYLSSLQLYSTVRAVNILSVR